MKLIFDAFIALKRLKYCVEKCSILIYNVTNSQPEIFNSTSIISMKEYNLI